MPPGRAVLDPHALPLEFLALPLRFETRAYLLLLPAAGHTAFPLGAHRAYSGTRPALATRSRLPCTATLLFMSVINCAGGAPQFRKSSLMLLPSSAPRFQL